MPDDDSFEIAKRLDEFGGSVLPPPKTGATAKASAKAAKKVVKRRSGPGVSGLLLIVVLALAGWYFYQNGRLPWIGPAQVKTQQGKPNAPLNSSPPAMIPALDGKGEVPAFTVQIPGTNVSPTPRKSDTRE